MFEPLTFSIGDGGEVTVRSWDELQNWLLAEQKKWDWLDDVRDLGDPHGSEGRIRQLWNDLLRTVGDFARDEAPSIAAKDVLSWFNGTLLVSTSKNGATVLDILKNHGLLSASFALGFITKNINMDSCKWPDDLVGALISVAPEMLKPIALSAQLKTERANFKNATRSLIERVDLEAEERRKAHIAFVKRYSAIADRYFKRKRAGWRKSEADWTVVAEQLRDNIRAEADFAIEAIEKTDRHFNELMALKAPVEYWMKKATEHGTREKAARKQLLWYFPLAIVLLGLVFCATAWFLLTHPSINPAAVAGAAKGSSPSAAPAAPVAIYFVISGGLLFLSTIALWIGRLLTKLYLSEHHLRNDASERATMTTTYLALTTGSAASAEDRSIILNALFRSTPDGIVKDEGPSDSTVQAVLAKLLVR